MGSKEGTGEHWMNAKNWYHPRLSTIKDAEDLLKGGKPGSFLVRPSTHASSGYAISLRHDDVKDNNVYHVDIINKGKVPGQEGYFLAGHSDGYQTLYELLEAYRHKDIRTRGNKVVRFCHVMNCEDLVMERWFHGFLPAEGAVALLKASKKRYSFLVRESLHEPGVYVISVRTSKEDTPGPCQVHHIRVEKKGGLFNIVNDRSGKFKDPKFVEFVKRIMNHHFMLADGRTKVALKYGINSTMFIASDIKARTDQLSKVLGANNQTGFVEEFMKLNATPMAPGLKLEICMLPQNRQQNRYKNILPYDHTLVKLTDGGGRDYINANYIRSKLIDPELDQTTYIASQGPLAHTMVDFWRMVVQERSRVIVMTTKVVERGKNKCSKYWPDDVNPTLQFDTDCGTIHVTFKGVTDCSVYCLREFSVHRDGQKPVNPFTVVQYHFIAWPDFGVPKDPGLMLAFLRTLKIKYTDVKREQIAKKQKVGPLIVHCSAGIGRTGTVIVLDILIQQIVLRGVHCAIDIFEVVRLLRQQRQGMIQTDPQHKFLYVAIEHYVGTMMQRTVQTTGQNGQGEISEYENLYNTGGGFRK